MYNEEIVKLNECGDKMDDRIQLAKELFFTYSGSFFQMHREGNLETYKTYQIAKELEVDWYKELINGISAELSIMNWNAVSRLDSISKYYKDSLILENVISFVSQHIMGSDSIVKLMYAENMISLIKASKEIMTNDLLYRSYQAALRILEDIITKPLVIDPGHELHLFDLRDKKSLNNRAKKNIDDLIDYIG